MVHIKDLRREYLHDDLSRQHLQADPLQQFQLWLDQAVSAQITDPTAMTLATVNSAGQPTQRIVLLKEANSDGYVFYTNYQSRKGDDIAHNAKVSLHFAWLPLDRQIKIQGVASKVSQAESLAYFKSRPRDSQLAAWASEQSHQLNSREMLDERFAKMQDEFSDKEITLPEFWGGYRVKATHYEFWQGRASRLHDSFSYSQQPSGAWDISRLAP